MSPLHACSHPGPDLAILGSDTTRTCFSGGGCFDITAGSAPESVDLLVVIGSGKAFHCSNAMRELKRDECDSSKAAHWPALQWIMRSPIVTEKTLTIHVPIRNIWELQHNKLFGFDHVVLDSSFSKPLSQDSVDELRKACGEATQARRVANRPL